LLTTQLQYKTLLPHVRWYFNTDGEPPEDSVVIEHNQLLARGGCDAEVAEAIADYAASSRVDELRFSGVNESRVATIRAAFPAWECNVEWRDAPYVRLGAVREAKGDYLSFLSSNTRAQLRRSLNYYRRRGDLRCVAAVTADDAERMLDELIVLHEARWEAKGSGGGFASDLRRGFHRAYTQAAVPTGEAQLLHVMAGDETVGIMYNLVGHGKVNFYQAGFHYEAHRDSRPGMVAHFLAIEYNLSLGMAEYDFLVSAPGEGRYKYSLSTDVHRLAWLSIYRPGWRTRYFNALRIVRRLLSHATLRMVRERPTGQPGRVSANLSAVTAHL